MLGTNIVVINDMQVALDLFEKRSAIYSSRPKIVFLGEMYDELTLLCLQTDVSHGVSGLASMLL